MKLDTLSFGKISSRLNKKYHPLYIPSLPSGVKILRAFSYKQLVLKIQKPTDNVFFYNALFASTAINVIGFVAVRNLIACSCEMYKSPRLGKFRKKLYKNNTDYELTEKYHPVCFIRFMNEYRSAWIKSEWINSLQRHIVVFVAADSEIEGNPTTTCFQQVIMF